MKSIIFVFSVLFGFHSQAGNILNYNSESGGISKVYISPGKVRTEYRAGKKDFALIYRADKHLLWLINFDRRTVTENAEGDLANSADSREQMTRSMLSTSISHHATEVRDQVATWDCEVFERVVDKKIFSKHCAVDLNAVGLEKSSIETLNKMEATLSLFKDHPMTKVLTWDKKWFSVRIQNNLSEPSTSELKSIEQVTSISDDLFEVPKGFQKFNLLENIKIKANSRN